MARGASPLPVGPVGGNLLAGPPPASPPPPGFNALAASSLSGASASRLNKRFPGAALQPETPPMSMQGGIQAPVGHMAPEGLATPVQGAPMPSQQSAPTPTPDPVGQIAAAPMASLIHVVGRQQFTSPELVQHAKRLTMVVRDLQKILKFSMITQADIQAALQTARRSGDHAPRTRSKPFCGACRPQVTSAASCDAAERAYVGDEAVGFSVRGGPAAGHRSREPHQV